MGLHKHLLIAVLAILLAASAVLCDDKPNDSETDDSTSKSWWSGFKSRVKSVLSRWRDDIRLLWDDVLEKARDMRSWTTEVFEALKAKMKQLVETRTELPEDEKNEIENFIDKLRVPADRKIIDP